MNNNSKNKLFPVYLLIGNDKLKIKIVLERLNQRIEEYGDTSLNSSIFYAENSNAQEIIQSCLQVPFASKKRIVIVHNSQTLKKDDLNLISDYLEKPCNSTVLILIFSKLAKTHHIYKNCQNINMQIIIDCAMPKKNLISSNIGAIAKSYGGNIDKDAANKLVELVGTDSFKLDSEIQKLLMLSNDANINLQLVEQNVSYSNEIKPWDFTNAFAEKNLTKCLSLYKKMPYKIEYQLLWQCCKVIKELICAKDLGQHASLNQIASSLNYETWKVKNHIRWTNNFTKEKLVKILFLAFECDKKMKSTNNSALAFEKFLVQSIGNN